MTVLAFSEQIFNENGYIVYRPNLASEADLLQAVTINPYAESLTQQFPLGTLAGRGRDLFQYGKNAATALDIAAPLQSAARIHATAEWDIVVGATAAIGDTTVTLTSTSSLATAPLSTKDGFKEGYIYFNTAAGKGQLYQIKGHAAASGTSTFVVTLYDPLTVALTTASRAGLVQHPCSNVVASKAVMTGNFAGIPLLAVTASYYFWSKIKGYAPCIGNAAIALGTRVVIGTTAAKADPAADVTTEVVIGTLITTFTTQNDYFIVDLGGG